MYTFKITQFPIRCTLKISGVPVVINQQYPIADQSNLQVENNTVFFGFPFDTFKYKIIKNGNESINEGIVTINFGALNPAVPTVSEEIVTVLLEESFFFIDTFPQPPGADKITITSITGKGSWISANGPTFVGETFPYYQLPSLQFFADEHGISSTYNVLEFTTSYNGVANPGTNKLTANAISEGAELSLGIEETQTPTVVDVLETTETFLLIKKAIPEGTYKLEFDTTEFTNIGTPDNEISFFIANDGPSGQSGLINTSGLVEVNSIIDEFGNSNIFITFTKNFTTTEPIPIIVKLLEVDALPGNVNALLSEVTLYIPITPVDPFVPEP
jgi:hypothetical protein